jgi:YHS domain-containing protein
MVRVALLLVLIIFIARAFWRLVDGLIAGISGQPSSTRAVKRGVQMVRDPVCGVFVVPDRAVTITDGRRQVFFCSTNCRDTYRARTA